MSDERDLLEELVAEEADLAAALSSLEDALPKAAPSSALRDRLMNGATLEGRFDRHISQVEELLDLGPTRAKELLDSIDTPGVFAPELPGVEFYWLEGGPKTRGCVRGFVRVDQSAELPDHGHLGEENILVLQGVYIDDSGRRLHPGEVLSSPKDSTHGFGVARGGADLLMLVVVRGGYEIAGQVILPRD